MMLGKTVPYILLRLPRFTDYGRKMNKSFSTGPKIKQTIGFIGDGNMSKAICTSITNKGLIDYTQVYVSSPYIKNLDVWKVKGANVTTNNTEVVQKSDIVFLAVKPNIFNIAIQKIIEDDPKRLIADKLFVSILAGISIDHLEKKISHFKGSRVIRIMPNTPMVVGEGCTVYCPGNHVSPEDINTVKNIIEVTGRFEKIPEYMINAASAISSSGPAFAYLFIEAMSDGGVRMGLHRDMATTVAAQTIMGAAKMVLETGKHMGALKDEVCSAGGMTICGVHELEKGAVRGSIMNAVEAAAKKAARLTPKDD